MRFQEGNTLGGRRKGSKNKVNVDMKEVFDSVFVKMGGEDALLEWANGHKTLFYELYAKVFTPKKLKATVQHRHEDFISYITFRDKRKLEEAGKPAMLIDAPASEVKESTQSVDTYMVRENDNKS